MSSRVKERREERGDGNVGDRPRGVVAMNSDDRDREDLHNGRDVHDGACVEDGG